MKALVLLLLAASAQANVCTSDACATSKPKASLVSTDRVYWCNTNGPDEGKTTGCNGPIWTSPSAIASYSWVMSTNGWQRLANVVDGVTPPITPTPPPPVPYTFSGYACRPSKDPKDGEIRRAKQGDDSIALVFCDTPTAIKPNWFCYSHSKVPDGVWGYMAAIFQSINPSRPCTASEKALLAKTISATWPTLKVTPVTIVVAGKDTVVGPYFYRMKSDGTLGSRTADRAPLDRACNYEKRVKKITNGKDVGTEYFWAGISYAGENLFAKCTITGAVSK